MFEGFSDTALLRIGIMIAALILFVVIIVASRKKPGQGKRLSSSNPSEASRREPTLREAIESETKEAEDQAAMRQSELDLPDHSTTHAHSSPQSDTVKIGARPKAEFDKIVSLYLAARVGQELAGADLVVAAEKAGLIYGHMNIFHRMVDKHPEQGPIFSVANLVKPGAFDLRTIKELTTPGISFFMTLPGPLSALDAWDTLLPTAQRMAELLNAVLLDDERNPLGRQRIANIRDELRAYDRAHEKLNIRPGR